MTYTNLPPTLFEMFGSLDDRVRKLETGPSLAYTTGADALVQAQSAQGSSAAAYAAALTAQTQATQAETDAQTALANAAVAYNKAVGSLQPSAATIVNASNQMTAINGTGITVYSGASATSGARVVLNSVGFAGYDASNNPTFAITASTGAAVFSGSITGSSITGSTLNIAGNCIINSSGFLTATGATITGQITATSGSFTGSIYAASGAIGDPSGGNWWSITSTGLTGNGTATINAGKIIGTQIQVPAVSPLFSVDSSGSMTATSGTIGGVTIGSSTLTGGTIQTSSGSTSIKMVGSTNSLDFYTSGSLTGQIYPYSSNGIFLQYGTSSTNPNILIGAGIVSLYANSSNIINLQTVGGTTITSSSVTVNSSLTVSSGYKFNSPDIYSTTNSNAANVFVTSSGYLQRSTASSMRYKMNITDLTDIADLDPKKLLNLHPRAFEYKPEYLPDADPRSGKRIPGFIAEEVASVYGIAADLIEDKPETWNERMIVPGILALVQDLEKRMTKLEGNNG